jgi:ClpP class serine protease
MNEFYEYLESKGIKDAKYVTGFVHEFLQDPSIFFDLTGAERDKMEKKLDETLDPFKKKKTNDTNTD